MVNFSDNVKLLFRKFAEAGKYARDYPIVIGGFIRDHYFYGSSAGDVDVVLKNGNNLQFIDFLKNNHNASDINMFDNTGTLHFSLDGFDIEIQSSNNPLVHFDIFKDLQRMGISNTWINRNVYERDFTINTLYYDVYENKLIDKTGKGESDLLDNKIIRCPIDSLVALNNNPIIIIRAIKFAIEFGLEIDADFLQKAPMFKTKFLSRINYRNNRQYLKGYIKQAFDMDFEKTYNYYENIDFLDIIPVSDDLKKNLTERSMGIIYRKPVNMVKNINKFINKIVEKEGTMNKPSIKIHQDSNNNKLIFNFAKKDISKEQMLVFNDLINKGIMDDDTELVFLDQIEPITISDVNDSIISESIEVNQHLYDTIKGKQEYRQRKKKENKKKTIDMWNTLEQVKKIVGEGNETKRNVRRKK